MLIFVIKQVRKNKNMSLCELSRKTNISRAYLFDLENNRKFNPTLKILYDIAEALEVNIKDLFYTELDLEKLRIEMYEKIDKYGINSKEALEASQVLDLLINIKMNKK